jgi:hypothetical protein
MCNIFELASIKTIRTWQCDLFMSLITPAHELNFISLFAQQMFCEISIENYL